MAQVDQAWELAKVLFEARTREAWGSHGEIIIARLGPWRSHAKHPLCAEAHLLAYAEAKALLKLYEVNPRG